MATRKSRVSVRLVVTLAVALLALASAQASAVSEDSALQAEFIARAVRFVEWPEGAFESEKSAIRVAILGDAVEAREIGEALAGATSNGRRYVVRQVSQLEQASGAHILIVGEQGNAQRRIARQVRSEPLLSISLSFDFAEYGGVLGMEMYKGKVAFAVNHGTARDVDLKISSQLLRLASNVY